MTAYAKNRDVAMVEQLNTEAIVKYDLKPSKHRTNALILAYCKSGDALNAEKVLREMVKEGLRPDAITYTTVIDAYKRQRKIDKCWELYDYFSANLGLEGDGKDPDEFMLGYMVRLCAATHDSEKAILIFNTMEQHGYVRHAIPYNSIMFALASTKRYSEKALEYWRQMHVHNVVPDRHTFVAALKACSQLGDVKTAFDILQEMKLHAFPMTEHVYNELIRVYAGACRLPHVPEKEVDMYLEDAMALFRTIERDEKNEGVEVNIQILNSLVSLFAAALRPEEVETKILPLYEKHRVKHDVYTYQELSRMYLAIRDLDMVFNLWDRLAKEGIPPSQLVMNAVLEAGIRKKSSDRMVEVLEKYVELKK